MSWQSGFQIRVVEGPDQQCTPLDLPRMSLGRARTQGSQAAGWILFFDKAVSRQHAELHWDEKAASYRLQHQSKTNFTWVDNEPLQGEIVLRAGQKVKVGGTVFVYEVCEQGGQSDVTEATPSALASPDELTVRLNTDRKVAPVSLRQSESLHLIVLDGADKGKRQALTGFYLTIGRRNKTAQELLGGKGAKVEAFDQMVELSDPDVHPNHVLLKWDELRGGFSTWKNPGVAPVPLIREADGVVWQGYLNDTEALIRRNDKLKLGNTILQIGVESKVAESQVKPVSL